MRHRRRIWLEIVRPSWRWGVLVPLGLVGTLDTLRDDVFVPDHPELYQLAHLLPHWSWQTYGLIFEAVFLILILESAYRAINWREELIEEMAAPEETLELLTKMHGEGLRRYRQTELTSQDYIENFKSWEAEVIEIIKKRCSVSELHGFTNYSNWHGGTYTLAEHPSEQWMTETERTRINFTDRICALSDLIKCGAGAFLGPKTKLLTVMESRK